MNGWKVFAEIKELKKKGPNKSQAERIMNINYKTVTKYWDMTPEEYAKAVEESKCRTKKLDKYKNDILSWIREFNDISAAQIYNWLKEKYGELDFGQSWLHKPDGSRVKLYCFAMVLFHSRFKYVYWLDKPFTTATFIEAHDRAFEYFGGMPKEIVYDQDRVL